MTALSWLIIGAGLWLGHAVAVVVTWIGGPGELVILLALFAISGAAALFAIRYENRRAGWREERQPRRSETSLTPAYDQILAAIERGDLHQGLYENGDTE